jgi:hypothetical protein
MGCTVVILISDNMLDAGRHAAVWRGDDESGRTVAVDDVPNGPPI